MFNFLCSFPYSNKQKTLIFLTIFTLISFILLFLTTIIMFIVRWSGFSGNDLFFEHWFVRILLVTFFFIVIPCLYLYSRYIEPRWLSIKYLSFGINNSNNSEEKEIDPIRVAVISDLHVEEFNSKRKGPSKLFDSLAHKVNLLQPHFILLLGDCLNSCGALERFKNILSQMNAKYGKYAVRGNWDVWYWNRLSLLEGTGFIWLDNEVVRYNINGIKICFIGMPFCDDFGWIFNNNQNGGDREEVIKAKSLLNEADRIINKENGIKISSSCANISNILEGNKSNNDNYNNDVTSNLINGTSIKNREDDDIWKIFLYHSPDLIEDLTEGYDIYLSGHTHGGQIVLPFFGAYFVLSRFGTKYSAGLYRSNNESSRILYINSGIGLEPSIPYRMGCRPEITLIKLTPKKNK